MDHKHSQEPAPAIEIRTARPEKDAREVSELLRFFTELSRARLDGRRFRDTLAEYIDNEFRLLDAESTCWEAFFLPPTGAVLVARADDTTVGCVAMREVDPRRVEIKRLYVVPAYRGRGVARKLLLNVMNRARSEGYETATLECFRDWLEPISLYRKFGFRETSPERAAEEHPLLTMEVRI